MIKGVTHAHLGTIWYHLEPSDVPFSPNKFLVLDFFLPFLTATLLQYQGPSKVNIIEFFMRQFDYFDQNKSTNYFMFFSPSCILIVKYLNINFIFNLRITSRSGQLVFLFNLELGFFPGYRYEIKKVSSWNIFSWFKLSNQEL